MKALAHVALLASFLSSGCAGLYLHRAPRSPSEAWPLPVEAHRALRVPAAETIRPDHAYTLPELIDIAESTNPETRIGWERARQAALGVGAANAEYFPTLSAATLAGYQHTFFPLPMLNLSSIGINPFEVLPSVAFPLPPMLQQSGFLGVDTFQVLPFLSVRWPLLDLGRGPGVRAAENQSIAANALFTAEHQKIIYDVATAYFRLSAARAQIAVCRDALERTRAVAKAAEARFAHGIATVVERSEATREVAQAEYNLAQAEAGEIIVYTALVAAMGIAPVAKLEVATNPSRELPARVEQKVDAYVESALASRADLRAARARLPATEASLSKSLAAYAPRINVSATAGAALLGAKIDDLGLKTVTLPNVTAGVSIDWLLFDGGLREIQAELARSRNHEAAAELVKIEHQALQEVITAYNQLGASLSRYSAASVLLATAIVADDAVSQSYINGLATLTDAMNAQKARALASAAKEQAFADALVAATQLAFTSGELTSASAVPRVER